MLLKSISLKCIKYQLGCISIYQLAVAGNNTPPMNGMTQSAFIIGYESVGQLGGSAY